MKGITPSQLAVLRALAALPDDGWVTAEAGGFHTVSAQNLSWREPSLIAHSQPKTRVPPRGSSWLPRSSTGPSHYSLTSAGRALVAGLKAEGRL